MPSSSSSLDFSEMLLCDCSFVKDPAVIGDLDAAGGVLVGSYRPRGNLPGRSCFGYSLLSSDINLINQRIN
jgi:hypothetical protein